MSQWKTRRCVVGCLAISVFWAALGQASAEEKREAPPTDKEIADLIRRLGDDKFAVREKAHKALLQIGKPAVEALRKTVGNTADAEIVHRAKQLVEEIDPGATRRGQFARARKHRAAKEFDKALAILNEMTGPTVFNYKRGTTTTPRDQQGWAYASLVVRKEKAMLREDIALAAPPAERLQKWSEAVQEWIVTGRTLAPRLAPLGGPGRDLYFDLYFEQKRCSVLAFKSLGVAAFQKNANPAQALNDKFARFAKDFHELQSQERNPDLPQTIKDRIKELLGSVEELKKAYEKRDD